MSDNKTKTHVKKITDQEALDFHQQGRPGKVALLPTKNLTTQRDLSLAYSPGVAVPCQEIAKDPNEAYKYTAKGNTIAVISNGTAVLGLGSLGALASKPVMEGKSVLFKKFADIDGVDIEVDTKDIQEFVNAIKYLGPSWGGINLEDVAAPECFEIEKKLKDVMDIPIFHDDQHGTAIIVVAGLINACELTNRKLDELKVVVNGAGAAAVACCNLIVELGVKLENILMCDRTGVISNKRNFDNQPWKQKFIADTDKITLADALDDADFFMGLSVAGAVSKEMIAKMKPNPIVFAMANPVPEIMPEDVREVHPNAIIATGRSDYNNQVNNVLGFPYIFRGALDVMASDINDEMKIAAASALAELAKEPVPENVSFAYQGRNMTYGPDYIIPVPFDPRLIHKIPLAVAKAAVQTGVARKKIDSWQDYERELTERLNQTSHTLNLMYGKLRNNPVKQIFSSLDDIRMLATAKIWNNCDYGSVVLLTKKNIKEQLLSAMAKTDMNPDDYHIIAIDDYDNNIIEKYTNILYNKLQRKGYIYDECRLLLTSQYNIFSSIMVQAGDADSSVIGFNKPDKACLEDIKLTVDTKKGKKMLGFSIAISGDSTVLIADTLVTQLLAPQELADVTVQMADIAKSIGITPRVALLSFSNFGDELRTESERIKKAKQILDDMKLDFEYDGEISPDVALDEEMLRLYPFCNLTAPANILIMPGLHSAFLSSKLLSKLGQTRVIGPIISGLTHSIQVVPMSASQTDLLNIATITALDKAN